MTQRRCRKSALGKASALFMLVLVASAGGMKGRRLAAVAALVTMGRRWAPLAGQHVPAWGPRAHEGRPGGGLVAVLRGAKSGAASASWRLPQAAALLLVLATALSFAWEARLPPPSAVPSGGGMAGHSAQHLSGLCWSGVAIVAKPVTSALRKSLANCKEAVGHVEQVGVASLLQGLVALGIWLLALPPGQQLQPPPMAFWALMAGSSVLNAVIRTCETRAYAIGELSLCAPFLAFDPVMQLAVGALVMPFLLSIVGLPCTEGVTFTLRHAFAVASITQGMLALSFVSSQKQASSKKEEALETGSAPAAASAFRLPRGAGLIILNCFLYGFTYRMDARACRLATSTFYFACCRLLMAATCLFGSMACGREAGARMNLSQFAPFLRPQVALRLLAVVFVDGFYMLSMYRAVSLISPVFVSAVKRGGGVLVSALLGSLLFGERLEGRWPPLLAVAVGVTLLCL